MMHDTVTYSMLEFTLLRDLCLLGFSGLFLWKLNRNPVSEGDAISTEDRRYLLIRACLGYASAYLLNGALQMISFDLLVVITQTLPFMATYLGFRINKEPGYVTEIIGMMICFACVAYIIYSEEKM